MVMTPIAKKGYKQTEHGIIPEEWQALTIQDLIKKGFIEKPLDGNHGNIHPKSEDFVDSGIPFVMANNINDGYVDLDTCHFIRKSQADNLQKGFSITGDVLLTHKGTVGNVAIVGKTNTEYIMLTPQVTYYRVKNSSEISNFYIKQYFLSNVFQEIIKSISGGGTRAYIGITSQRQLPFILPPIQEQIAIAAVLSDYDKLIELLEKQIAKKKNIKQSVKQQLLTGKKRLLGFREKWEVKKLGDIADVVGGGTPSTSVASFWNGDIEWFTPTEVGISKYIYGSKRKITIEGLKNSSARILNEGTILLTSRAGIGDLAILKVKACTNQGFQSLVPINNTDSEFLYYLMRTKKNALLEKASGSTFLEISPINVKAIEVRVPKLEEQTAIATILSDMDTEIERLESQLSKYQNIKEGMMQQLLTGKIRVYANN